MFTDDFNRPDEALEVSANWTRVGGTTGGCSVSSNELLFQAGDTNSSYLCPDQGNANHYSQIQYVGSAGGDVSSPPLRVCVRMSDQDNFYGLRQQSSSMILYRVQAGAFSNIGSVAYTWSTGDVWRLEAFDDRIEAFLNGTSTIGPVTGETFNNTVTRAGVHTRVADQGTSRRSDNFEHAVITQRMFVDISNARGAVRAYPIGNASGQGNIQR